MIIPEHLKKRLLITSAVIIGVGIIFLALKGDTLFGDKIAVNNHWQDSLRVIPSLDATSTLAVQRGLRIAEDISIGEDLSATEIFSRKIFASYILVMNSMAPGTVMTDDQAAGIANELIKNIAPATTTVYTLSDIKTSSDNSKVAFIAYSKSLTSVMNSFVAAKTPEIPIISEAFSTGDEKKVALLVPIIAQYKKLEADLLAINIPTKLADIHLRLVQAHATMRSALTTMHGSFNDPVAVLGAFSQYKNGIEALAIIAEEYKTALNIN